MTCLRSMRAAALLAGAAAALVSFHRPAWGQAAAAGATAPLTDAAPIYLDEPPSVPDPTVVTSGKVADKYDEDGQVRIEREVLKMSDDSLVNHGEFTEYYPNGKKFAQGRYDHGVHDGSWSFWFDNGQLCKTVSFKMGRPDGAWDVFREDGTLLAKKAYKDNKRDGQWVIYHPDGKTLKVEEQFVDGERNGESTAYFANGKPMRKLTFKAGQLEGPMTEWDETGRKIGELSFKAGMRHGDYVMYKTDGTTQTLRYDNGRLLTNPSGD